MCQVAIYRESGRCAVIYLRVPVRLLGNTGDSGMGLCRVGYGGSAFRAEPQVEPFLVILLCKLLVGGEQAELDGADGRLGAV